MKYFLSTLWVSTSALAHLWEFSVNAKPCPCYLFLVFPLKYPPFLISLNESDKLHKSIFGRPEDHKNIIFYDIMQKL